MVWLADVEKSLRIF